MTLATNPDKTSPAITEAQSESDAQKALITTAVRRSGLPDLAWLLEFDPPQVSADLRWPPKMNDNKVSNFVLPEEGWRTITDALTRAEGKSLLDFIESTKAMNWVGYKIRQECDNRLIGVMDLFWALDLLGKRTPVKGDCATVEMQWKREINFLLLLINRACRWLSEEEHIELLSVAVHLRTQCCPRSENALAWDDIEDALKAIPNWARECREAWHQQEIELEKKLASTDPAD